ncbi:MAG: aminoacetone oxidase family FAD-binding enzyme [Clostridia bacterium]|nr:aminoacetone oxidase family FAD-binding enzyme [Clostridia bacterium]
MKKVDIIIVGGGAGGLAAAIEAKRTDRDKSVTVLEHLPRVGKKILATGNGRCNLGNLNADTHLYTNAAFASKVMNKFNAQSLVEFFQSMGLYTRADSEGRLYPLSNTAASVLDALRFECENLGVDIVCDYKVNSVKKADGFIINGEYKCDSLILACGGKAAPSQGSDGSGYPLLKSLGHSVTALSPCLVQLLTDTAKTKALKGVRASASLSLTTGGNARGEILFTDYGISGIAAMDLSRYVVPDKKAEIIIDLLPEYSFEAAKEIIVKTARHNPALPIESLLGGLMHKAVGTAVIKSALGFLPKAAAEIGAKQAGIIAAEIKNFTLALKGTKGFNDAQVTKGGASVKEFDAHTLESKKHKGLYACGELLDVDGACGGFNLAFAFSSGRAAGQNAAKKCSF